jgi:hypothetical protein
MLLLKSGLQSFEASSRLMLLSSVRREPKPSGRQSGSELNRGTSRLIRFLYKRSQLAG